MRSKVEPVKEVARLIRTHMGSIVAWAPTQQTNSTSGAMNSPPQAATRMASDYNWLSTLRTVIFLIVRKPDFAHVNPYAA
ncbi:hypothetical protein [Pelomicrobium sp.]|jgi:hypothetical protein|uniref:hypothetical protein n=1 Tax=Pelomicrobium sp. TaxID=2815319 RepID=UPI002FDD2353